MISNSASKLETSGFAILLVAASWGINSPMFTWSTLIAILLFMCGHGFWKSAFIPGGIIIGCLGLSSQGAYFPRTADHALLLFDSTLGFIPAVKAAQLSESLPLVGWFANRAYEVFAFATGWGMLRDD